jgi:hypothetical protein
MASESTFSDSEREPTRSEIDQMQGSVLLEFGTDW